MLAAIEVVGAAGFNSTSCSTIRAWRRFEFAIQPICPGIQLFADIAMQQPSARAPISLHAQAACSWLATINLLCQTYLE
jgi:hypothetical protein